MQGQVTTIGTMARTGRRRLLTTTERNWLLALLIVVGSGAVFAAILALESATVGAPREQRLVWHAAESSMRYLSLSHFVVGAIFLLSSKRMRRPTAWPTFLGLLGLGAALCWGFGRLGALGSGLGAVLFYVYFLVHEFRDETMMYGVYGDAPADAAPARRWKDVYVAPLLVFGLIASVFVAAAAFRLGGARRYTHLFGDAMPVAARWALGLLPAALVATAGVLWWRRADRLHDGGARAFVRANRPIFLVFLGIFAVLLADIAITGRVYAIVTLHVTVWYVFVLHQLTRRPPPEPAPKALTWRWMRSTAAGFNFVHLGVLALILAAGAVWAYGFRNDPDQSVLRFLLSREAFPYWTIMHVTVSFLPSK